MDKSKKPFFGFMSNKKNSSAASSETPPANKQTQGNPVKSSTPTISKPAPSVHKQETTIEHSFRPTLVPGSDGEHYLQKKFDTEDRANAFYNAQVLDYLSPKMQEFVEKQEFMFVSTADRHGECDCTSKFGTPGFIRVLSDKYIIYPERRGNGVFANLGNITENPHIGLLIIDFFQDTIGLHINGKVRIIEHEEMLEYQENLPQSILNEISLEGPKCPERWIMVEVEEAYVQCSKHIPLLKKEDKRIDWGTDSAAAKKVDYFQLQGIPLYDRIGGDKAMEIAVDLFYQKVLQDELVGKFFKDTDMESQRLKQKSFLSMAFGGPYQYSGLDIRASHQHLVKKMGLTDVHFDRVAVLFQESLLELRVPEKEIDKMMEILETFRGDVLGR
jgi:truncated hemoglobin YjbI/predicted pyridoxine 5'-phosphate oxidase superfamily flavin-nucleotide-binding protein